MARIDDLLAGDDDEVDEEYVRKQRERADRRAAERPMKPPPPARVQKKMPSPPRPSAEARVQKEVQNRPKTTGTQDIVIAKRLCKAQSTVRYPKDHPDPEKAGQPILDAGNARQLKPCERPPMHGQEVCQKHGGMAPQAQKAARLRLLAATEPLIAALIRIGLNETLSAADRTRAINSALDRAGIRGGVEVNVADPRWQQILGKMFGGQDDPDRTIDGDWADKQPANVELTPQDIVDLNAAVGERFTPPPGLTPEQMANYVNSDDTPPARWGLAKGKRKR